MGTGVQDGCSAALASFRTGARGDWSGLPFLGTPADGVAAALDARARAGAHVLPVPGDVFAALAATPPQAVRVAILGQDPYPTPGDAHGLAFSYRGGRLLPQSLRPPRRMVGMHGFHPQVSR